MSKQLVEAADADEPLEDALTAAAEGATGPDGAEPEADRYAAVQHDEVDQASWPYMITIESRSEDEAPVRAQAMQILEKVDAAGWGYRMTSDADESLLIENAEGLRAAANGPSKCTGRECTDAS